MIQQNIIQQAHPVGIRVRVHDMRICISSRHFDAIGTKTCQIMFRGRFNDILKADQHYVALNQDFSNLEDALARFLDPTHRRTMVEEAYSHVMDAHTYDHRMRLLYDILLN